MGRPRVRKYAAHLENLAAMAVDSLSIESRVEAEFGCDSQATQMSNHRALWWSFSNRGTGSTPNGFGRQCFHLTTTCPFGESWQSETRSC